MSETNRTFWEVFETCFSNACDTTKECAHFLCVFLCIIVPVAMILFFFMYLKSNDSFEPTESRLSQQLRVVDNARRRRSISEEQTEEIMKLLISSYSAETDNMNPVINPNVKPIELETILAHFKIDKDGVKQLSNPNEPIGEEAKKDW